MREKRPRGDLSEEIPAEKKSKTEEDLEHMMQLITGSQRKEQQGALFSFRGPEEASSEARAQETGSPGAQPLATIESRYKGIQASSQEQRQAADEQPPEVFPDSRLLSAFDMESGQLRMALLQSMKPKGEEVMSEADYWASEVSIDMNQIHYKDLIKLHQQSTNILYRDINL